MYRIRIRTVKENLAEFFFENLPEKETADIKCIRADIGVVPKKNLEKVYSLTPAVMKNYPEGYWRDIMSAAQFEKRLLDNLVKKYKYLTGEAIDENIMMYNGIRFMNSRPIKVSYKGITLLGDKIELTVAQNRTAQKLMYMALEQGFWRTMQTDADSLTLLKGGERMLQDCIEIFETKYREKGERFILDNYELSPGTYRLVLIEDEALSIIETVDIKRINKEENQGSRISFDLYFQLKFYDYYSKLLEMNKPIDPKKIIHSNNYMAFAVKKASIKEGKVGKEAVERYFCVLKDPCLKYKKGKTAEIYRDFESREGAPDADLVEKIEEFILTGKCWADIDCDGKDYLKIFFVFSDEEKTKEIYREKENDI